MQGREARREATSRSRARPPVGVVVPTHDRSELVLDAVRSALGQTTPPREIVVVDDGSSPQHARRLEGELGAAEGVRLLRHDEARGGSAARNRGWREASAAWVAFLDDDDVWKPEKLEEQLRHLTEAEADFGWTAYQVVDRSTGEPRDVIRPRLDDPRDALALSERSCSTLVVRRELLSRVGGFDESLPRNQDWDLFLRLDRAGRGAYLDRALTVVRHHVPDPESCIRGRERLVEKWRSEIAELPRERRREVWAEHHWLLWTNHAQKGDLAGERRHVLEALRRRPLRLRYWRSALITLLHHLGWRGRHTAGWSSAGGAEAE